MKQFENHHAKYLHGLFGLQSKYNHPRNRKTK